MTDFKTESYSASKPSFNQYGAATTVYFNDDSYMELDVEMSWDNRRDEVEIDGFNVEYYDREGNELEVDIVEVEQIAIDICEHYKTFGSVENEMAKAHHADHA